MPRRRVVEQITNALQDYDETFLECRNLGHVWRIRGYFRGADGIVARRLECQRCDTGRLDRWGFNGERIGSSYQYVEDYRIPEVRVAAGDVRVEMIRRAVVYASEAEMLDAITTPARSGGSLRAVGSA